MKKLSKTLAWTSAALLAFALVLPGQALAATATIATNQTISNVASSSIPTITTSGGAAITNATGTLTLPVKASIVNNDYFILTDAAAAADAVCFYFDINNTLASDAATATACQDANGVAGGVELAVSGATTAADVALIAHTAINAQAATLLVTSTNNTDGTLTLTHDTAGTAGNIALNAAYMTEAIATGGNLTALTGGAAATAASATITLTDGLVAGATDQSVNIDALGAIALGAVVQTAAEVAGTIRAGLTGAAGYAAKDYGVTGAGANIIFTRESTGTAGNGSITITDGDYGARAQTVTFTPDSVEVGAEYTITIDSTRYSTTATESSTVQSIVEALSPLADASSSVACSEDNLKVTCVASSAGTAFTYSTDVSTEGVDDNSGSTHRSNSGRSGGGGSSSSSSAAKDRELQTMIDTLKVKLAELIALKGNNNANAGMPVAAGIYARDLTAGSNGVDVKSLQMYLNTKGFDVAMTGAGSKGMETETFGPATQAALAKFQAAKGISPASGFFGPKTRAYVAANP